jgi:hypothetical protein
MVFCRECGQPISATDKFCERCGTKTARAAAVQSPVVSSAASAPAVPVSEERAMLISSGIRLLPLVGLLAGILCLVAIFTPWTALTAPAAGIRADATAWDLVINAKIMGEEYGREAWACLALSGAVVIVAGSLLALATPKTKAPWGILGITTGGLLSAASALWALSDIDTGTMLGITVTYGFGLYLTLVGGIVACVVGITGFFFDANKRNALTDILKGWQRVGVTPLGNRLVAAIALIGCLVAFVGLFTPWATWSYRLHGSGPLMSFSASPWDGIRNVEGLKPHVYYWLALVGASVALLGAWPLLMLPRQKLFWAMTATGATLTLVGVALAFEDGIVLSGGDTSQTYEYGIFLMLAGGIIGAIGGLLGLVMLTDFYKRRASPIR